MDKDPNSLILQTLTTKSFVKADVYKQTLESFLLMKKVGRYMGQNFRKQLKPHSDKIAIDFKEQGAFQFSLKIAGDLLVFVMHTNVFTFDRSHQIWNTPTVKKDELAAYCGTIHIYNFLADSFKYNRLEDAGYLIGRIFINKDKTFFIEGKRQLGVLYNNFGQQTINTKSVRQVMQSAILFSLDFDLLVPDYDNVAMASVGQLMKKNNSAKMKTSKRLGFKFYDDSKELTNL